MAQRRLPIAPTAGLGAETIMDRALAAKHGVAYVHLAAFAIDIDRVARAFDDEPDLPFGWDVLLTESYLLERLDADDPRVRAMVEEVVLDLVEGERDADAPPPLGSQLPFALYDAIERGTWPAPEEPLFRRWKPSARRLVRELEPLWSEAAELVPRLCRELLQLPIDPPFAPPVAEALRRLATTPAAAAPGGGS